MVIKIHSLCTSAKSCAGHQINIGLQENYKPICHQWCLLHLCLSPPHSSTNLLITYVHHIIGIVQYKHNTGVATLMSREGNAL